MLGGQRIRNRWLNPRGGQEWTSRDGPRDEAAGQHPHHHNGLCDGSLFTAARRETADSFSFDEKERGPKWLLKISLLRESMWDCGRLQSFCFVLCDMNQLIGEQE